MLKLGPAVSAWRISIVARSYIVAGERISVKGVSVVFEAILLDGLMVRQRRIVIQEVVHIHVLAVETVKLFSNLKSPP